MVFHVALWSLYVAEIVVGDKKGIIEKERSKLLDPLLPGSSPVDWCEDNYSTNQSIAEFVNTISNFGFLVFPPVLIILFKPYGKYIQREIHYVWVLLIVVGIFSAYFHATLSLVSTNNYATSIAKYKEGLIYLITRLR
jgi:hypothetical protein